jgi:hypothetical protein
MDPDIRFGTELKPSTFLAAEIQDPTIEPFLTFRTYHNIIRTASCPSKQLHSKVFLPQKFHISYLPIHGAYYVY